MVMSLFSQRLSWPCLTCVPSALCRTPPACLSPSSLLSCLFGSAIGLAESYRVGLGWAAPVGNGFNSVKGPEEYELGNLG